MKYIRQIIILSLTVVVLMGCGSFQIEPSANGQLDLPDIEATVEARLAEERLAEVLTAETEIIEPEADQVDQVVEVKAEEAKATIEVASEIATEESVDSVETQVQFMPEVGRFSADADAEWGAAFCPESVMPICIRPYAIESLGDQQVLLAEVWGTGDSFLAGANYFRIAFDAIDSDDDKAYGSECGNTESEASHYNAGFGYFARYCFRTDQPIEAFEMQVAGGGANFKIKLPVGENSEPVGGYSFLANARELESDTPFNIGPATITIHSREDLGEAVKLEVTVQANDSKMLVHSPEWIVIGSAITFATVDENGIRGGWAEGKMGAYEVIGGEIKAGESQTGTVILSQVSSDAGLIISFGPASAGPVDSIIFR